MKIKKDGIRIIMLQICTYTSLAWWIHFYPMEFLLPMNFDLLILFPATSRWPQKPKQGNAVEHVVLENVSMIVPIQNMNVQLKAKGARIKAHVYFRSIYVQYDDCFLSYGIVALLQSGFDARNRGRTLKNRYKIKSTLILEKNVSQISYYLKQKSKYILSSTNPTCSFHIDA